MKGAMKDNKWKQIDWLVILLTIFLVLLVVYGVCIFFGFVDPRKGEFFSTLTAIGTFAGGIVLTVNAIYIGKRATAQDRIANAQVVANEQNLFNQAIGHLNSIDESVRLGGIHALYKLVEGESTRGEYLETVTNILCAHVRSKTNGKIDGKLYKDVYAGRPSVEIQGLLDLLTKGNGPKIFKGQKFDFSRTQLQRANFWGAQLQGANFWGAQLQSANFMNTYLQDVNFWDAQLENALFINANLRHAYFMDACLQHANFQGAQLQGANFEKAHLQEVCFLNAQLQRANFKESKLQGSDFRSAQLQGVNFEKAHSQGSNFEHSQLQGANFQGAQLQGAYSATTDAYNFEDIINKHVNQPADMQKAIVIGGLTEDDVKGMEKDFNFGASYWSLEDKKYVKNLLRDLKNKHTGDPIFGSDKGWLQELKDQDANLSAYSKEEAEAMIDEYRTYRHFR